MLRRIFVSIALAAPGVAGAQSPPAPAPGGPPLTRVLFGSCANQDKPLPIFDAMSARKPELLVLLGDNVYCDLERGREVTPDVIREKYAALAALPAWQKLRASCPLVATWDDHDYGLNDAGVEWPHKAESQRAFHDFLGTPADSPLRKQEGVYSSHRFGPEGSRVQVILLDLRYFRTALKYGSPAKIAPYGVIRKPYVPQTDEGATMLGAAQWAWLEEQLRQPAEVRLIGTSVQCLADDHPFEKWANMPAERSKFLRLLRDTKANGVILLSGDRHVGELSLDTTAISYPLYDLTASGLNQANDAWRAPEVNRRRVACLPYGQHFGEVDFAWGADPAVTLSLRDIAGELVLKQTVPVSLLTPRETPDDKEKPKEKDKPEPKRPEGVLSPEEAAKKVGEVVKVQFTVKSGRAVNSGRRILLNSDADFKAKANFTVVFNEKAKNGKYDKADYDTFKDKVIRATGKVTVFKDAPQIQIDDEKSLEIVEAEKK